MVSEETIYKNTLEKHDADCEAQAKRGRQPNKDHMLHTSASLHRQGDSMILQAKAGRVRVLATPGKQQLIPPVDQSMAMFMRQNATKVDENYMMIGNVDQSVRNKIINHEYIDFA